MYESLEMNLSILVLQNIQSDSFFSNITEENARFYKVKLEVLHCTQLDENLK